MHFSYRRLALRSLLGGKYYFPSKRIRLNRLVFRISLAVFIFGLGLLKYHSFPLLGLTMAIGSLEAMAFCYLNCRDEIYAQASRYLHTAPNNTNTTLIVDNDRKDFLNFQSFVQSSHFGDGKYARARYADFSALMVARERRHG